MLVLTRGERQHRRLVEVTLGVGLQRRRRFADPAQVLVPAAVVGASDVADAASLRRLRVAERVGGLRAHAEREGDVPVPETVGRGLPGQQDVALGRAGVRGELEGLRELRVPVGRARVADARLREGGLRGQRGGVRGVLRGDGVPLARGRVVGAVVGQVRVGDRVELVGPPGERLEVDVHQHRRGGRVGDVGLPQAPAVLVVGDGLLVGQAVVVGPPDLLRLRAVVGDGEAAAVRDDEVHRTDARRGQVRVVDLGHLATLEGEPDVAGPVVSGAETGLVRGQPTGMGPGRTGGLTPALSRCRRRDQAGDQQSGECREQEFAHINPTERSLLHRYRSAWKSLADP